MRLHLLAWTGTHIDAIREVISHRAALDQCTAFIARCDLRRVETSSTADAARQVAHAADPALAAIASEEAAAHYGLSIGARDIQDEGGSKTRVSIVERRDQFA